MTRRSILLMALGSLLPSIRVLRESPRCLRMRITENPEAHAASLIGEYLVGSRIIPVALSWDPMRMSASKAVYTVESSLPV